MRKRRSNPLELMRRNWLIDLVVRQMISLGIRWYFLTSTDSSFTDYMYITDCP